MKMGRSSQWILGRSTSLGEEREAIRWGFNLTKQLRGAYAAHACAGFQTSWLRTSWGAEPLASAAGASAGAQQGNALRGRSGDRPESGATRAGQLTSRRRGDRHRPASHRRMGRTRWSWRVSGRLRGMLSARHLLTSWIGQTDLRAAAHRTVFLRMAEGHPMAAARQMVCLQMAGRSGWSGPAGRRGFWPVWKSRRRTRRRLRWRRQWRATRAVALPQLVLPR